MTSSAIHRLVRGALVGAAFTLARRALRSANGRDAVHVGAGGGWSHGRREPFATVVAGASALIGTAGVVRLDVRYRLVADPVYRSTWRESLRQLGVALGVGLALPSS